MGVIYGKRSEEHSAFFVVVTKWKNYFIQRLRAS